MASHRHRDPALGHVAKGLNKSMPSQQSRLKDRQRNGGESRQNHARTPRHSSINSYRLPKRPSTGLPVSTDGNLWFNDVGGSSGHECTKRLLLLHLELIQQLQEQLKAKDVEITRLTNERDQMAVKVQRMERRMVLLQRRSDGQRIVVPPVPKSHKTDYPDSDDCDILEKTDPFGSSKPKETKHDQPSIEKTNSESDSELQLPETNSKVKSSSPTYIQAAMQQTEALTSSKTLATIPQDDAEEPLPEPCAINFSVDSSNPSTPASGPSTPGPPSPWMLIEPPITPPPHTHMLIEEVSAASVTNKVDCVQTRFLSVLHEGTYKTHEMDELDIRKASQDSTIKVPMWRIKSVHGHKSKTALVEDTSDVIYLKRHNKSEAEEKRIKRWDLRRIRQQRQHEALKKRYSDGSVRKVKIMREEEEEEPTVNTFLPNPNLLVSMEVSDDIAVSAFGQPLPLLQEREFDLPWFSVRSRSTVTKTPRKRKKLKGRLFHRNT